MITGLLKKIFGSRNERLLRQYMHSVRAVNALEPEIAQLSDDALKAKTAEFKQRHANGETLDQLLPEAFAVVREAGKRVLQMRHFDVQIIGGIALHQGKIAEMRTGEGKTLVATLPAYLNALSGKGVHVVTVNDYLAKRDSEWMGRVFGFLGLTVGVILSQMDHGDKQGAYGADITYGTNNEFGFDYLRDNMAATASERFQRGLNYAIVDEVDSILIDEARTPLIISGQAEDTTELYYRMNEIAPRLTRQKDENSPGDYSVDEKAHQVLLSEAGHERAEALLAEAGLLPHGGSLYDPSNINLMHHLYAALRAHSLYHRDQQYVAQEDEIIIVDEFTGRLMPGRRWSDGLHQAVEAKEGVSIQRENQTLASITFQNYFRMYTKLAGMTGTADTEAYEFQHIYRLETVVIPTHKPMIRDDRMDQVYQSLREKYEAVIKDIKDCYDRGQPVLVGTTSIENSELLSKMLDKEKLQHNVLNAKQHAREAEIVVQAGRPKTITIATNMAGRGTDIVLGGNPEPEINLLLAEASLDPPAKQKRVEEIRHNWQKLHNQVVAAGGLHIIATERHESRRVDNQLRGRSGRQGDPGSSRFYLALEDPLLRIFASDRVAAIMQRLKMPDGEAIEHPWVTRAIENAQRKVEARNFDMRKHLLEYDDVSNDQRKAIYESRNQLLESTDISERITAIRAEVINGFMAQHIPPESLEEQWDIDALEKTLVAELQLELPIKQWLADENDLDEDKLRARIVDYANRKYQDKIAGLDPQAIRQFERGIMLQSVDSHWREHLAALDHLRQGIHLRSYAQKTPTQEYKKEAFELFALMLDMVNTEVTKILMTVQFRSEAELPKVEEPETPKNVQYHHADYDQALEEANADADASDAQTFVRKGQKVGRNDPCPCGSGKKYKHCHGKLI
ncbi:MAG TPA: preprotein translocase subunit SecA [Burkholderiales bacterium]|jgi:preprotein translocase subunit SecA|nr:preprotein translocase subunit SecA [Burkholderiales bacterium]